MNEKKFQKKKKKKKKKTKNNTNLYKLKIWSTTKGGIYKTNYKTIKPSINISAFNR